MNIEVYNEAGEAFWPLTDREERANLMVQPVKPFWTEDDR